LFGGGTNMAEEFHFLPGELPAHMEVPSGMTSLAWSPDSSELCAVNLTDMFRFKTTPLRIAGRDIWRKIRWALLLCQPVAGFFSRTRIS